MTKYFEVTYHVHGQEKKVRIDYVPEEISQDTYKLSSYLTKEIAKKECVKEEDISISSATCTFKS